MLIRKQCGSYFHMQLAGVFSSRFQPAWVQQSRLDAVWTSAGRYTGSYRIPVFIFLTIWIFKIPQYRCHLNNVRNATLLERGLFSLLYFGEDTDVCVTKRESSETEALVECDEREEVIHNIHIDSHKYPPSAAISSCVSHTQVLCRYDGFPSIAGFLPS